MFTRRIIGSVITNTNESQLFLNRATQPTQVRAMSKESDRFKLPRRLGTGEKSVWVEYVQLVSEVKPAANLGQGFADYHAPKHVKDALIQATSSENALLNQYTRGFGHPRLVNALSKLYSPLIGRTIDPFNEMIVTSGAYEALYCSILGHVDEGDEVIVIEPFFDCYEYMIKMAGGVPKFIALKPNRKSSGSISASNWVLDEQELKSLFNEKTKMIIVNTPHNPVGKVFTSEELKVIADLCVKHNVLCVSDEVYEWIVYEPHRHIRMATLPGMWDRTITIGSAGKSFCITGWKIGWAYGPAALIRNLQVVHQNCVYTCCTPVQEAIASAMEIEVSRFNTPDCYFHQIPRELLPKREAIVKTLQDNGFVPSIPDGGFFIMADWTNLAKKIDLSSEKDKYKDYRFTKKFVKETGVLAIPPSAFYSANKHLGEDYARFCFIKKDEIIAKTDELMKKWTASKKSKY